MAVGKQIAGSWSSGAGKSMGEGCSGSAGSQREGFHRAAALEESNLLWRPGINSADETKEYERDPIHGRALDLARNDPQISGAIRNEQAAIVGNRYALDITLDRKFLGLSLDQAAELEEEIEDAFDRVAESPRAWFDASGRNTFSQMAAQALYNGRIYGEGINILKKPSGPTWLLDSGGSRPSSFSYLSIDPARLRTPSDLPLDVRKNRNIYHGIDRSVGTNYPLRYYFINNENWDSTVKTPGKRDPNKKTYTAFRPTDPATGAHLVLHTGDFTGLAHDTRPLPPLANIVHLVRMTGKYSDAVLDQAWKSAMLGLVIESDIPTQIDALFRGIQSNPELSDDEKKQMPWQMLTQNTIEHFASSGTKVLDSVKANIIPTGNKVNMLDPGQPTQQHEAFMRTLDRSKAMGLGHSYESLTGDSSQTNFHGAMMQDIEQWRRRRMVAQNFPVAFGKMLVQNWLMEKIVANEFQHLSLGGDQLSRLNWWKQHESGFRLGFVGPGREWANPVVMENTLKQGLENESMSVDEHTKRVYGRRQREVENERHRAEHRRQKRLEELGKRVGEVESEEGGLGKEQPQEEIQNEQK